VNAENFKHFSPLAVCTSPIVASRIHNTQAGNSHTMKRLPWNWTLAQSKEYYASYCEMASPWTMTYREWIAKNETLERMINSNESAPYLEKAIQSLSNELHV